MTHLYNFREKKLLRMASSSQLMEELPAHKHRVLDNQQAKCPPRGPKGSTNRVWGNVWGMGLLYVEVIQDWDELLNAREKKNVSAKLSAIFCKRVCLAEISQILFKFVFRLFADPFVS